MSIAAQFPELALQQESEQRPHKVSFNTDAGADIGREVTQALQRSLAHEGIDAQVVYSGGRDVDILPARAGKGKALAFLLRLMEEGVGAPTQGTLVCGDSGNDADLFQVTSLGSFHPSVQSSRFSMHIPC